jgi:hypothetical protein
MWTSFGGLVAGSSRHVPTEAEGATVLLRQTKSTGVAEPSWFETMRRKAMKSMWLRAFRTRVAREVAAVFAIGAVLHVRLFHRWR